MLAHKTSFPAHMGVGPSHVPSSRDYSSMASHRTPLMVTNQNGPFASPTESEFSEAFDGPDSVR